MIKASIFALILATSTLWTSAQQPRVTNTQLHSEPVGAGLAATVTRFRNSPGPIWLGYQVQALSGTHLSACSSWQQSSRMEDHCCSDYRLEEETSGINNSDQPGATAVYLLLRLDRSTVQRVRLAPAGCTLNAAGLPLTWLTGVSAEESASYLGELAARAPLSSKVTEESLVALAMHATPKATRLLASLSALPNPEGLREKAAFWLGAQRGHDGYLALHRLLANESQPALRQKLTFDLSINSDPAAIDELVQIARTDPDSEVRGQALFWLAQKASRKTESALQNAIDHDPDFAVKKKAVFALSQLPRDESIPKLEHIADTNADFALRKEAIFWLGQTNDPRALAYMEQILKR